MIVFDDGELEVALVTYNRPRFIEEYLRINYVEFNKRNIKISIYDSSTDNSTKNVLESLKLKIDYHKIDSNIDIGYKPMLPILNTKCKYLWVAGDSKYFDISDLDDKIFLKIKEGFEFIIMRAGPRYLDEEVIYTDCSKMILDCFISSTCIGHSIYKMSMFNKLINDAAYRTYLDEKYRNNYGFAWLGYFFESYLLSNNRAIYIDIDSHPILSNMKKQQWAKRFYECWVENLIDICKKIPDSYQTKLQVPRFVWKKMRLDSVGYCIKAKMLGGLDLNIYRKYNDNGMLSCVNANRRNMLFIACLPKPFCVVIKRIIAVLYKLKHIMNRYR